MSGLVRMPYSNNWRVFLEGESGGDRSRRRTPRVIRHDCGECTVPAASGRRGIRIADRVRRRSQ